MFVEILGSLQEVSKGYSFYVVRDGQVRLQALIQ